MDNSPITADDSIIAVMGMTGAGKSTFVQLFTDEKVVVSHSLESQTQTCQAFRCTVPVSGHKVILVDTPGFDDTFRTDTDVLRELASWLNETYKRGIKLTGIIYLHRIIDPRVGGSGLRNLRMFKRLVGDDNLSSIVLATTFWDAVSPTEGNRSEMELLTNEDFWADMISRGSISFRHNEGRDSGGSILAYLLGKAQRADYQIQREMVDHGLALNETAAGIEVQAELQNVRLEYEAELRRIRSDMSEALANQARKHAEDLRQLRQEHETRLRQLIANQERLNAKAQELWEEREHRQAAMEANFLSLQRQMQRLEMENQDRVFQQEKPRGRAQERSVGVDHRWPTSSVDARPILPDHPG